MNIQEHFLSKLWVSHWLVVLILNRTFYNNTMKQANFDRILHVILPIHAVECVWYSSASQSLRNLESHITYLCFWNKTNIKLHLNRINNFISFRVKNKYHGYIAYMCTGAGNGQDVWHDDAFQTATEWFYVFSVRLRAQFRAWFSVASREYCQFSRKCDLSGRKLPRSYLAAKNCVYAHCIWDQGEESFTDF